MKLIIDPLIFQQFSVSRVGLIIAKNIDNTQKHEETLEMLRNSEKEVKMNMSLEKLDSEDRILAWRTIFEKFGANPQKHYCSCEALIRRVVGGQEIPDINPLVNVYNAISLQYVIPFGGEDLDTVCGDIHLTVATGEEPFYAIGQTKLKHPSKGEVVYKDQAGVTCRKWNWRECNRTKFTEQSKNVVIVIEGIESITDEEWEKIVGETSSSIQNYLGGDVSVVTLDKDNLQYDFGIEGRTLESCIEEQKEKMVSKQKQKVEKHIEYIEGSFENIINVALKNAIKELFDISVISTEITYPENVDYGDFSCNISMQISKELKKNPREIVEMLKNHISLSEIERVEIAGPGFLNFFLSNNALLESLDSHLHQKQDLNYGKKQPIVVEYSQPNIAKPLGAHHLLSTIIGQSIYNLYGYLGYKPRSVNHIGDWGTQFGKLIYAYKHWGDKEVIEKDPIPELLKLYVHFHEEVKKDVSIEDSARAEFLKLEQGDEEIKILWKWMCEVSMQDVQKIYDKLDGIHFDHIIGESFYEEMMKPILDRGKKDGFFKQGDKGAWMYFFEDESIPPMMVQRSDGATLYATRDFAQVFYRSTTWNIVKNIMVVDVSQELHFKQYFEIAKRMGLNKTSEGFDTELVHVKFGRMQFKDKKMSTREGNIVLAEDVINEAADRAKQMIQEKNSSLSGDEKEELTRIIAIGALKYNILSQNRLHDIVFDWDKMLSLEGNSAPYMQYTHARAKSILRKADEQGIDYSSVMDLEIPSREREILVLLHQFPYVLVRASEEYFPHLISTYLYTLAQKFNSFYNAEPVLNAENEVLKVLRLQIVKVVSDAISLGMGILGIRVPERM